MITKKKIQLDIKVFFYKKKKKIRTSISNMKYIHGINEQSLNNIGTIHNKHWNNSPTSSHSIIVMTMTKSIYKLWVEVSMGGSNYIFVGVVG